MANFSTSISTSISKGGHFNIPEGTTTIKYNSWEEWGVDKEAVKMVTIPDSVTVIGGNAFEGCSSLSCITIPDSTISIGFEAFVGCDLLTTVLIRPTTTAEIYVGDFLEWWGTVFELPQTNLHDWESYALPQFEKVTRISAPDAIVNQLNGRFAEYSTLAEVPRAMRAAPDATSWAGVKLWLHWSDPEVDAADKRVLCKSRQQMVWTVMHVAERLEILPSEMWLLIMTFVKHE